MECSRARVAIIASPKFKTNHPMKISTIFDHIDNGHMAVPEVQPGYEWNREQVGGLYLE